MMNKQVKRIFIYVFVFQFVDLIAFTLILPLLPKLLEYYSSNDQSRTYELLEKNFNRIQNLFGVPENHNKVLLAGLLGSWFSGLQFASSPLIGALSDRFGRKPILLLALSGTVLSYAVWFISSDNFGLFILSRTIGGLCKSNVGLSLAIISDVADDQSRGKGMAMIGASFSLAFIVGPMLGAYLALGAQSGSQLIRNPASVAVLLSLLNLALTKWLLPETFKNKFGFSSMDQGKLYLFSGTIMALVQGGFVKRIRGGKEPIMAYFGLVTIIPAFIWMGLSKSVNHVYMSMAIYSMSSALVVPCLTTVVSSRSPPESRGAVMGTLRSIGSLARAIGPLLTSILYWTFGPTISYLLGAIALLIPVCIMKANLNYLSNSNKSQNLEHQKQPIHQSGKKLAKAN